MGNSEVLIHAEPRYLRVIARVQGLIVVWPNHRRLLASDLAIRQLIIEQVQ